MQYPEGSTNIFSRLQVAGFDSLCPAEQVFICIDQLEREVNNGGFHQFFWNSAGDNTPETLAALEQIGVACSRKRVQLIWESQGSGGSGTSRCRQRLRAVRPPTLLRSVSGRTTRRH